MSTSDILQQEQLIKNRKAEIELAEAITRLGNTRDFKKIFGDAYFEDEPARIAGCLAAAEFQTPEKQLSLVQQLRSVGELRAWLQLKLTAGRLAKERIEGDEATLEDLLKENA